MKTLFPNLCQLLIVVLAGMGTSTTAGQDEQPIRATMVAQNDNCVMHCFKGAPKTDSEREAPVASGLVLSHTNLETGDMLFVLSTGTVSIPTRRLSYSMRRVIGCLQVDDTLVVALYQSGRSFSALNFEASEGVYSIRTYAIATGKLKDEYRITKRESFPDAIPAETCARGSLTKLENSFQLFKEKYLADKDGKIQDQ